MKLVGSAEQSVRHYTYDASGTITSGSAPQLLLPQHQSRSMLLITNNSANTMYLDIGSARATCTLSGTVVNSAFTITNAGFGYTHAPLVRFLGGGYPNTSHGSAKGHAGFNTAYVGASGPNFPSPPHPAVAYAVLTGGAVTSIVLTDPGANYVVAPMLVMFNSDLDPIGAAIASPTSGYELSAGGSLMFNGTCCPTDPISIFCATPTSAFTCKFMT